MSTSLPPYEFFDKTDVYMAKVKPLLDNLYAVCQQHGLPLHVAVEYIGDAQGGTSGIRTNVQPKSRLSPSMIMLAGVADACRDGSEGVLMLYATAAHRAKSITDTQQLRH